MEAVPRGPRRLHMLGRRLTDENRAVAALRRYAAAALARDWDAVADSLADAYRMEDRRTGLKNSYDKAADLERSRATVDVGFNDIEMGVLELRGEASALLRGKVSATEADFVIDTLLVVRVDRDDRLIESHLFDGSDLDAARAQFEVTAERNAPS